MFTYRITTKTQCGKTNVIIQTADTRDEAMEKYYRHNALTHTPMVIVKVECRYGSSNGTWCKAY